MTDESVECFNCGRANPEWAQVCRSCGVPLRRGQSRTTPTGRVPTDRDSLIRIAAVIATILAAVVIGLFVSSLNTTDATVGQATPTPSPTPPPSPRRPSLRAHGAQPHRRRPRCPYPGTSPSARTERRPQVADPVDTFTPSA